jgi:beta-N-acetylhexosaminidase
MNSPCPGKRILLTLVLVSSLLGFMPSPVQAVDDRQIAGQIDDLLSRMTPEEKVGQLFITGFKGSRADQNTMINDLVSNYHIGGVVLSAANDNFVGGTETISEVHGLIQSLQQLEWSATFQTDSDTVSDETRRPVYMPLLIGLTQEGDGAPGDQIISGLTPMPSAMAMGATWNSELVEEVGILTGKELSALGINLVFTSALDVLGPQEMGGSDALGTRSLGGNPFWVGRLGKAYINGIHQGSNGRMLVVANGFPGSGNADRNPSSQLATVRRTMEQLDQLELKPFYTVTGLAGSPGEMVDGLVVSHIRYAGLQGNIRSTTRPLSFDANALENLLSLQPLQNWRTSGGLLVSDNLGSPAVVQYYSLSSQRFSAHQVALGAFLAGHDVLYVDNFVGAGDENEYITLVSTLGFFAQKYREDPAFAQRVDGAVRRILTKKLKMYPSLILGAVLPPEAGLEELGQTYQTGFKVAQNAATLISPNPAELGLAITRPPGLRDRIVFFTDTRISRQCSTCSGEFMLPVNGFENAVLQLYGPQSGGLVFQYNLSSYNFADLTSFLDGTLEPNDGQDRSSLEDALLQANWIVFSMLDVDADRPESLAVHRLLTERPDLTNQKNVIGFAFNAPFFLDATDISKMTAFYGLYSKTPGFVDVAARILFDELTPIGSLPISVLGSGYDLNRALSPEPSQVIPLMLDKPEDQQPQFTNGTSEAIPLFEQGDILPLVAGKIYDRNRRIVQDGTPVQFIFTSGGEGGLVQRVDTVTQEGIARTTYQIKSTGLLQVQVTSGGAMTSEILLLDISPSGAVAITAIVPTAMATEVFEPTLIPSPTPETVPTPVFEEPSVTEPLLSWLAAMFVIWGVSFSIYFWGQKRAGVIWGLRWGLLAAVGGLLMYIFLSLGFPGGFRISDLGLWALLTSVMLGVLAGWGVGWLWRMFLVRSK